MEERKLPVNQTVRTASFSPDGKTLATGDQSGMISVIQVATATSNPNGKGSILILDARPGTV